MCSLLFLSVFFALPFLPYPLLVCALSISSALSAEGGGGGGSDGEGLVAGREGPCAGGISAFGVTDMILVRASELWAACNREHLRRGPAVMHVSTGHRSHPLYSISLDGHFCLFPRSFPAEAFLRPPSRLGSLSSGPWWPGFSPAV